MVMRAAKDVVARKVRDILLQPVRQDLGDLRKQVRSLTHQLEKMEQLLDGMSEKDAF